MSISELIYLVCGIACFKPEAKICLEREEREKILVTKKIAVLALFFFFW